MCGLLAIAGCESAHSASLTAPTSLTDAAAAPLSNGFHVESGGPVLENATSAGDEATVDGTLTITSLVSGTACPTRRFEVYSYVFATSASTQYEGGTCADLRAGSSIHFRGTRSSTNSSLFEALQITFGITTSPTPAPTPTPTPPPPPTSSPTPTPMPTPTAVTLEGVVSSILPQGTCPSIYFSMANGQLFGTNASTRWEGGTCASLRVGTRFRASGDRYDSGVRVSQITLVLSEPQPAPTPTPTPTPTPATVTIEGVVATILTSPCPALYFSTSNGQMFGTNSSTRWEGGTCTSLRIGSRFRASGDRYESGVLVSQLTLLSSEAPPTPTPTPAPTPAPRTPETPVSGEAVVSSLVGGTACPTLNFTIGSYTLTLSATTRYEGGTCADVRPGLRITLTGTRLGDGTIAVSTLVLRPEPARPQGDVDGEGVVTSSVDGTACPALRVRIGEYTIAVDAATEYVRGSCTSLRPGVRIHVRGTVTGERTVLASQISVQD